MLRIQVSCVLNGFIASTALQGFGVPYKRSGLDISGMSGPPECQEL